MFILNITGGSDVPFEKRSQNCGLNFVKRADRRRRVRNLYRLLLSFAEKSRHRRISIFFSLQHGRQRRLYPRNRCRPHPVSFRHPLPDGIPLFDIRDYGARTDADFKTNRTAINDVVAAASAAGGGIVLVDGGEYSVANIRLLSNVALRINRGAALVNITYDQDKTQNTDFNPDDDLYQNALIYAVRKSYCLRSTLRPRRPESTRWHKARPTSASTRGA